MKALTARIIQFASLAITFILCLIGIPQLNYVLIGIGFAIGTVGTVIWIIFGRCKNCGGSFGRRLPDFCPHCGEKADKE